MIEWWAGETSSGGNSENEAWRSVSQRDLALQSQQGGRQTQRCADGRASSLASAKSPAGCVSKSKPRRRRFQPGCFRQAKSDRRAGSAVPNIIGFNTIPCITCI